MEEINRKEKTIKALTEEIKTSNLTVNVANFQVKYSEEIKGALEPEMSIPYLIDRAFTSATYSGNISLLSADLQSGLSAYYRHLQLTNLLVNEAKVFYSSKLSKENIDIMFNMFEHIKADCEFLNSQGIELLEKLKNGEKSPKHQNK